MPSDPPVEEGEDPGDATLSGYPPFKQEGRKVVIFSSEGAKSEVAPDETKNAAALYLRLRNQFPHFTEDMLSDEFIIQWEGRQGGGQSMRTNQEVSQHGDTAVADPRVTFVERGDELLAQPKAQPRSLPLEPSAAGTPEAGLPSVNEPAVRYKDDEKFGLEGDEHSIDEVDLRAMALTRAQHEKEEEEEIEARQKRVEESEEAARRERADGRDEKTLHPRPTQLPADGKSTPPKPPLAENTKDALKKLSEPKATPAPASKPSEPKKGS